MPIKESDITKEILEYLKKKGHFAFKHWGGAMGRRGVSDIVGCINPSGIAFFLEVKKPGLFPDSKQEEFLFEAAHAGALTACVHSVEEVKKLNI